VLPEHRLGGEVVDEILWVVVDHRDLLEDDLALRVHVFERGREDHVRHRVERLLDTIVGNAGVDDRGLPRRRRVQLAAHRVEELGDVLRAVAGRALEQEVLDEVRDARAGRGLVTRPGGDPEPERRRPDAAQRLGRDALAAREGRDLGLAHGVDPRALRAGARTG
jgi:hypothetical protein